MADDKPVTPEQQLLKLIEGSRKAGKEPASGQGAAKVRGGWFSLSKLPGALLGRLSFIKRDGKKRAVVRKKVSVDIAGVNQALSVVVACALVYVCYDAAASANNLRRPPNFVPPKDMKTAFTQGTIEPLKETSYYLQKVSSRDIFREGKKAEENKEEKTVENAVDTTSEAVKSLALVGISWSSNPDAIIEDKAHQRTFFVKRGQMVGDNVRVEAIFKDHVVVSAEDKEYELR